MIIEFINEVTKSGYRIFSATTAREIAHSIGAKDASVNYILKALIRKQMIRPLFRGNYAIEDHILSGSPIHKFEIAMHLVKNGAICCWSAMAYHGLADQVLSKVYVYAPHEKDKTRSMYKYKIEGYDFCLIQIGIDNLFGIERQNIGEIKVSITDLERTLIDGLVRPQYCGGIREVLNAFELSKNQFSLDKLINYASKSPIVVQKRLGWILEQLSIEGTLSLEILQTNYYDKLDPAAPRRGKYNKKWMLMENF